MKKYVLHVTLEELHPCDDGTGDWENDSLLGLCMSEAEVKRSCFPLTSRFGITDEDVIFFNGKGMSVEESREFLTRVWRWALNGWRDIDRQPSFSVEDK